MMIAGAVLFLAIVAAGVTVATSRTGRARNEVTVVALPGAPVVPPVVPPPTVAVTAPATPPVSPTRSVMVVSEPAGADVYQGAVLLGVTPLVVEALPGALPLTLRLERFEDATVDLATSGPTTSVTLVAERRRGGTARRTETTPPPEGGGEAPTPPTGTETGTGGGDGYERFD
jgi:hypothetical protein